MDLASTLNIDNQKETKVIVEKKQETDVESSSKQKEIKIETDQENDPIVLKNEQGKGKEKEVIQEKQKEEKREIQEEEKEIHQEEEQDEEDQDKTQPFIREEEMGAEKESEERPKTEKDKPESRRYRKLKSNCDPVLERYLTNLILGTQLLANSTSQPDFPKSQTNGTYFPLSLFLSFSREIDFK